MLINRRRLISILRLEREDLVCIIYLAGIYQGKSTDHNESSIYHIYFRLLGENMMFSQIIREGERRPCLKRMKHALMGREERRRE
jgi:hypothetical protein